jgi:hypothetical protein
VDSKPAHRSVAPFAAAAALACAGGAMICTSLNPAELRNAALWGAAAATVGAAFGLAGLFTGIKKGAQGLLVGFGVGFLARMITVAAGLVLSGAKGNAALVYALSFFAIYAATQAVEIAFVWLSSRRATP